jgi:dolichyl-diphosphooligosaccharide--protein glycosyltransferase
MASIRREMPSIRYRDGGMSGSRGPAPLLLAWLLAAALFACAVAVRALSWSRVFVDGGVIPFGNDAWYHLRRIAYSVLHFPEVLSFDRYINFPRGAKPIWTPLFDWGVALAVRPFFVPGELASVERVAVWVPPLLGGLTVVVLFWLARRHLDLATASVSAALLCVLPAHYWYSQLGFVDHHAAVALVSAALLAASMDFVAGADTRPAGALFRRGTFRTGLLLGLAVLVWPGSLLHVALAELGLGVYVATRERREDALFAVRSFACAQLLACAVVTPFGAGAEWPQWSSWSPLVLTRFQPWLFGMLSLLGLACAALWTRTGPGASPARRFGGALALGVTGLAVAAIAVPELRLGVSEAWGWLSRDEPFQAAVTESKPLLMQKGRLSLERALSRLTGFALLSPLLWVAALTWAWRRPERAPLLLWLGWTLALAAATLAQRRFFNSFSPAFALLIGWSLCTAWRVLPAAAPRLPAALPRAALAVVTLACLAPGWSSYSRDVAVALRPAGEALQVPPWLGPRVALVEMTRWMALRTPRTRGWLDPDQQPEYAVLAPWDLGHAIGYSGRRPTVVDNFGDDLGPRNFALAGRYWESDESAASTILDDLGARYVVLSRAYVVTHRVDPRSVTAGLALQPGPPAGRPSPQDGAPLERHRLVYESRLWGLQSAATLPLYRVFEHVPGARVVGRADPGSEVELSLPMRSGRRDLVYRASARAAADGRFELRVPYATAGGPRGVRVEDPYTLECKGERASVVVSEAAVRSGGEVIAPPLCGAASIR